MHIHTYGSPSDPTVILLHPVGLTGQQFYQFIHQYLKEDYYTIAPDQGGHGEDPSDYISPANDGKTLLRYLKEKELLNVRFLLGASIGAAAALRLLEDPELHFDYIHLDSAPVMSRSSVRQSVLTTAITKEMKKHHKKPETREKEIQEFEKDYGTELAPVLFENFMEYSEKSLKNLCAAFFCNSSVRNILPETQQKMVFDWGGNDEAFKHSKKNVQRNFPQARIRVRPGEGHCTYLSKNTGAIVEEIERSLLLST